MSFIDSPTLYQYANKPQRIIAEVIHTRTEIREHRQQFKHKRLLSFNNLRHTLNLIKEPKQPKYFPRR